MDGAQVSIWFPEENPRTWGLQPSSCALRALSLACWLRKLGILDVASPPLGILFLLYCCLLLEGWGYWTTVASNGRGIPKNQKDAVQKNRFSTKKGVGGVVNERMRVDDPF
jgi:hypothetical protein